MKESNNSSSLKINGIKVEDMNTIYLIKQINLTSVVSIFALFGGCLPIPMMCLTAWETVGLWPLAILPLLLLAIFVNVKRIKIMKNELKSRNVIADINKFVSKNFKHTLILYILGLVTIGTTMFSIVSICLPDIFDNTVLTVSLIITAIVCAFLFCFMLQKSKKDEYRLKTDAELIAEFKECATYIQTAADGASGLKGVGSRVATNSINNSIAKEREIGEAVAKELTSRGYKVDTSVLMQNAVRAKSKSDLPKIIGGAITGGILAGGVGAVIGAAYQINKTNKK